MNASRPPDSEAPPTPVSQRRSMARALFALMGARGAGLALRIPASLIVASLVGPDVIGFVAWIGIFSMYAQWFTVGVTNGAERLVPMYRAQQRSGEVRAIWGVTSLVCLSGAMLCFVLGAAAWGYLWLSGAHVQAWKFLSAGILAGFTLASSYVSTLLTSENRLKYLNRFFFIGGLLWWGFLPLAWGGAPGLTVRTLLVALLPAVICIIEAQLVHRPVWNRPVALQLAREGLPILFSRFLLILSFGLDRTLIAACMNDRALGHYVIATSVIGVMRLVQYAMSRVLTPNLGELYGRTHEPRDVAIAALHALPPMLAVLLPCVAIAWFAMEPVTRWLLPAFLPGVAAGKIALLSGVLISILGTNIFFVVIGRQKTLIAMLLTGLFVQAAVSVALYRMTGTLESFAWGFVAGAFTSAALVNGGIVCYLRRRPRQAPARDGSGAVLPPDSPATQVTDGVE